MLNQPSTLAPGAFKVSNLSGGQSRHELSRQWLSRPADQKFLTLDSLHERVKARADSSEEIKLENKRVEFITPEIKTKDDMNSLDIGLPGGRQLGMTHWSFGQLCGLAGAPAGFMRRLPGPNVADDLSFMLQYRREVEEVKVYASKTESMAFTGPDYGRIYDYEVVDAVRAFVDSTNGRWKVPGVMDWSTMVYNPNAEVTKDTTTLFASDRDTFIFLVDDLHPIQVGVGQDGEPDYMFRGFYCSNSEFGAGTMKLAAFYLRALCCNRIMWGVEGFQEMSIRHTKNAPFRFMEEARPALQSFAEGSEIKLIEAVKAAKRAKVADSDDSALEWLQAKKLSKKRATDILAAVEKEEGRKARSVWDMAQGITAVAREIPYTDERLTLELEAKRLLDRVA